MNIQNENLPTLPDLSREQPKPRTISIEDSFWEYARALGNGNVSRGIRAALLQHQRGKAGEVCEGRNKLVELRKMKKKS